MSALPRQRKLWVAYGWWLVGGTIGLHRFYVGSNKVGYFMLIASPAALLVGLFSGVWEPAFWVASAMAMPVALIYLADIALTPVLVRSFNRDLELREREAGAEDEVEI